MPDISKMIEDGVPIYVINRTHRVFGTPHLLMLEFPNPTGGRKSIVKLPPHPHPVNLSQKVAPVSAIGACQDFLSLLNNGALELIPPDDARRILADPDVQAAVRYADEKLKKRYNRPGGRVAEERRKGMNFKVKGGGSRVTDAVAQPEESGLSASDFTRQFIASKTAAWAAEDGEAEQLGNSMEAPGVGPAIVQFCVDLLENPELRRDSLMELRNMDDATLTSSDLAYMLSKLQDFDAITAYVRSVMAKRAGKKNTKPQAKTVKRPVEDDAPSTMDAMLDGDGK